MRRLIAFVAAALLVLGFGAQATLAAEPPDEYREALISIGGDLDIPAGWHADGVLVLDGDARVAGDIGGLVVIGGSVTLTDARVDDLVVVDGSARIEGTTIVSGDVRTLDATVTTAATATVLGTIRGLEADLVGLGLVLAPAFILVWIGFGLATLVVALAVVALAARQVRAAGALIGREPGTTLVAGVLGVVLPPVLAVLAIVTVVGIPLGLGLLLVAWPAVAFLGWLVAAIWIGERVLAALRGRVETERPYLAAIVGVILAAAVGIVPLATFVISLFGIGAVVLAGWRVFRHHALPQPAAPAPTAAPTAA